MKLSYEIFVRHEVYQILQRVSADDRERFCYFVESLADDPFRAGDATTQDDTGRVVQAKVLGRFVLFYWADHAAKEVRVVDLTRADG
ncbi:MAG: hypothetical protein QOF89_5626 [Acidobacteriota bacterium]|jgi:hypothetical protein|nr:hypothetical protein [Acidobacteriota bacterium]